MPILWIFAILAVLAIAGYLVGRQRALSSANGSVRDLHSLPIYYGLNVALTTLVPAFGILILWILLQPIVIDSQVSGSIPAEAIPEGSNLSLVMADVRRVANGLDVAVREGALSAEQASNIRSEFTNIRDRLATIGVALGSDVNAPVLRAAQLYRSLSSYGGIAMAVVVLAAALAGFGISSMMTNRDFRARNIVERGVMALLILAASIAILTTAGIVLSMLFETFNFFGQYEWTHFFFSLTWSPSFQGESELGIVPLLWGTLYISFIALLVAVPVGLYAAIYLSEYASKSVRGIAKPAIEILAGIPTIVYGLFALITIGPLLRDYFSGPLGLGDSSSSVMTAGIVMGIMLIPFVSSLSDDIINAVPQAMRDGSFGL
ncbi:MAG: phosphate ABC transporter permease family protein, partial [Pseudomonadota bacterium]